MKPNFEWDDEKAKANLKKHKVSFEEATTVFTDPHSLTTSDPILLRGEQRYVDLGCSLKGRVVVVVYTERHSNIRIISCRKATSSERKLYEEDSD